MTQEHNADCDAGGVLPLHVFTNDKIAENPFCDCGQVRNGFYRRTRWQRLTGRPRRPTPPEEGQP